MQDSLIKRLSERTINLISAGEVIASPASVVKELVENSIDAGAKKIGVWLESGGTSLIAVKDDGIGMGKEDLALSIERYTTSKLNQEDIQGVTSLGFRGEALCAIASVSRLSITSSKFGKAYKIYSAPGCEAEVKPAAHGHGTTVEVRDLFFATPARLNFLRSERAEIAACVSLLKKISLGRWDISFTCYSNRREVFRCEAAIGKDLEGSMRQRAKSVLGQEFANSSIYLQSSTGDVGLVGLLGLPTFSASNTDDQAFFVNSRLVQDRIVGVGVKMAYKDLIPQGRCPRIVLRVELDPYELDVNVHPAKSEVKFRAPAVVRSAITSAISSILSTDAHLQLERSLIEPPLMSPNRSFEPLGGSQNKLFEPPAEFFKTQSAFFEESSNIRPLGTPCFQIGETFIVSRTQEGMVIVDQHAAHERIVYEGIKGRESIESQALLQPVEVVIESDTSLVSFCEHQALLNKLGLGLEVKGSSVFVKTIPIMLAGANIPALIEELEKSLKEMSGLNFTADQVLKTWSCHHSIRASRRLTFQEMDTLLRQIESTPNSGQCVHGRPTYVRLSKAQMEKWFERS